MGRDEVNKVMIDQSSLRRRKISLDAGVGLFVGRRTHVEDIHSCFVHKEALKEGLDEY